MKKKALTLTDIIQRNEDKYLFTETDGEVVAMHLEKGNYIGINKIGSDIWQFIAEPKTANTIIQYLLGKYEVSKEQCTNQTMRVLTNMALNEMVVINSTQEG